MDRKEQVVDAKQAELSELEFGLLSADEIIKMSVCQVNSPDKPIVVGKIVKKKKVEPTGPVVTLDDERMGVLDNGKECTTCGQDNKNCPGHFGHIVLNLHILHPLTYFQRIIVKILSCVCFKCSRLLLTQDNLITLNLLRFQRNTRFEKVVERSEKIDSCPHCDSAVRKYQYKKEKIITTFGESKFEISTEQVESIFKKVDPEDIVLMGLNPERFHPKDLVLSVIPVIPPCSRPSVVIDGSRSDDDITNLYTTILNINNKVITASEKDKEEFRTALTFHIKTIMDNSKKKAKHSNGRPKKGVKERLSGKPGYFRSGSLGKRVDYAGRTVIGGDPNIDTNSVIVPDCIATKVTTPDLVREYNIRYLTRLLEQNEINMVVREGKRINLSYALYTKGTQIKIGDVILRTVTGIDGKKVEVEVRPTDQNCLREGDRLRRADGKIETDLVFPSKKKFKLLFGDIVHRHLQNGDIVAINRQPTLHRGGFLAAKVIRRKGIGRTIRIPLEICASFNADFDGKRCRQQ